MADMSSSLKVVNIALVFCASFSLLAIFILILFILTRCSDLVPEMPEVGSAGGILTTGAAPAAGRGGIGAGGGVTFLGAAGIGGAGGGVLGMGAAAAAGGGGGGAAAAGAATSGAAGLAAAGAPPPAPSFILRSLVPGDTVAPSSTRSSVITPAAGEGTGTDVLSVSISQMTSSSATESPTAFSHLTSPSEMESAKAGQTISFTSSRITAEVLRPRATVESHTSCCLTLTSLARPTLAAASLEVRVTRLDRPLTSPPFLAVTCRRRLLDNWFLPDPSMAAIRRTLHYTSLSQADV